MQHSNWRAEIGVIVTDRVTLPLVAEVVTRDPFPARAEAFF